MKLRFDLLKYVTEEDIREAVLANNHRYDPNPNFSKTGVGSLLPATPEDRAREDASSIAFIQRIKQRQRESEKSGEASSGIAREGAEGTGTTD